MLVANALSLHASVDPNREQMTRKWFTPADFAVQVCFLERASGDPVFIGYENTGFFVNTRRDKVPAFTLEHSIVPDDLKMPVAEIPLDDWESPVNFVDFIIQQRGSPAPRDRAASSLATLDITLESKRGDYRVDDDILNFWHFDC